MEKTRSSGALFLRRFPHIPQGPQPALLRCALRLPIQARSPGIPNAVPEPVAGTGRTTAARRADRQRKAFVNDRPRGQSLCNGAASTANRTQNQHGGNVQVVGFQEIEIASKYLVAPGFSGLPWSAGSGPTAPSRRQEPRRRPRKQAQGTATHLGWQGDSGSRQTSSGTHARTK